MFYCCLPLVDEIEDYSTKLDTGLNADCTTTALPPRKDLQIRPQIRSPLPSKTFNPAPTTSVQSGRAPIPPPKPQRPTEMDIPNYGMNEVKDSMYFILSPSGQSVPHDLQDVPQGMYEEMEYDEEELNRNPPPVWKPQPRQHHDSLSSSPSIIYSRIEAGKIAPRRGKNYEPSKHNVQSNTRNGEIGKKKSPCPLPTQKHAETQPSLSKAVPPPHRVSKQNPMKGIMNDPALMEKLHEKRQELYGPVDQPNGSVSSPDPMENYEEVSFDLAGVGSASNSDEEELPPVFTRVTNMTLPPRRHNIGSEVAMMQCQPEGLKVQEYLSFQPSPSHSPQGSVTDLSNRESYTRVGAEDIPGIPPRDAERMRKGSPQLARSSISPTAHQHANPAAPPVAPRARPKRPFDRERSLSQENFHQVPPPKSHELQPRPTSSSFESPPPIPFRNTSARDSKPPRRDLNSPLPLPSEVTVPKPPPRRHQVPVVRHSSIELCCPPVPVRHPNASGASQSASELRRHSPSIPTEDDAPPIPSRGAREKAAASKNSVTSLQRPHSTPDTSSRPNPTTRIRPAHVGEIGAQAPECAWNHGAPTNHEPKSSSYRLPPQTHVTAKPRPPTKPAISARPVISTKPSLADKPVISAKPQVSTKPKVTSKPPDITNKPSSRRPPVIPRTDKTKGPRYESQANSEIPPLPPR